MVSIMLATNQIYGSLAGVWVPVLRKIMFLIFSFVRVTWVLLLSSIFPMSFSFFCLPCLSSGARDTLGRLQHHRVSATGREPGGRSFGKVGGAWNVGGFEKVGRASKVRGLGRWEG